jgi:hypothetical protein
LARIVALYVSVGISPLPHREFHTTGCRTESDVLVYGDQGCGATSHAMRQIGLSMAIAENEPEAQAGPAS